MNNTTAVPGKLAMRRSGKLGPLTILATTLATMAAIPAAAHADDVPPTLPAIFPAPVSTTLGKGSFPLGTTVELVAASGTEAGTIALVRDILASAGVEKITTVKQPSARPNVTQILIGLGTAPMIRSALSRSAAMVDGHVEGYTIASVATGPAGVVTLAGHDSDGLFHAVQTFRQLAQRNVIPALVIQDHPAMPIRGTIEGFYGKPWSMADRTKHLDFLATVKANTYVYSPKSTLR